MKKYNWFVLDGYKFYTLVSDSNIARDRTYEAIY
jgi:hypothetical protein